MLITPGVVKGISYRDKKTGKYYTEDEAKGMNVIETVEKMSKSKLNGINPIKIINEYGIDVLRLSLLFTTPVDHNLEWSNSYLATQKRFIEKIHQLLLKVKLIKTKDRSSKLDTLTSEAVSSVTKDYKSNSFHTVIAKLMKFTNQLGELTEYYFSIV